MFHFCNFNIISDRELKKIKRENQIKKIIRFLECKKLYKLEHSWDLEEKCPYCDDDRKILVEKPDGSKVKIKCSCDKEIINIKITESDILPSIVYNVGKNKIGLCTSFYSADNQCPQDFYMYSVCKNKKDILNNIQVNNLYSYNHCYFTKSIVKTAAIMLAKNMIKQGKYHKARVIQNNKVIAIFSKSDDTLEIENE